MSEGRIYTCVGRNTVRQYIIPGTQIGVNCVEELCYYIVSHAELIDESIRERRLIDWLSEECGLKELARQLSIVKRQSLMLESFVGTLLSGVHYCSDEKIREIGRVIRANRGKSPAQRQKAMADYFLSSGRYASAYEAYDHILHTRDITLSHGQLASAYHNMGVLYARLFHFREAADYFLEAWHINGRENSYFAYLAAKRMELDEMDYLRFVNSIGDEQGIAGRVEEAVEQLVHAFRESPECAAFEQMKKDKLTGNVPAFENQAANYTARYKDAYRGLMV